ncbi:MAG TPA: O-antigen ligase family protein [Chitinophagaceae bacterium]
MTVSLKTRQFISLSVIFILSLAVAVYLENYYLVLVPFALLLLYAAWNNPRFIFLLLLFSLPFSFEYNFTPLLGTDIPDEGLMLLASFVAIAGLINSKASNTRNIINHPLVILLFLHLAWIVITAIVSTDHLVSFKYVLSKGWYIGAFVLAPLLIWNDKQDITVAAKVLVAGITIVVVMIIIKHSLLDLTFANVNDAVSPFFRNHVNYSSMLVCLLPVVFAFYSGSRRWVRIFLIMLIMLLLAALFFSYARGAWVAMVSGAIALLMIHKRRIVTTYILCLLLAIGLLQWLRADDRYLRYSHQFSTTIFHKDFREHLVATYKLKDVSTAERFYRWIAGVRMVKDNPLTGVGPNTFNQHYKPYAIPAYKTWVSDNKEHSTIHNYFLLLIVEQGLPGLIFFIVLLGAMLYYAQSMYHRATDRMVKKIALTTGVMIVMIATVNFLSDLVETDKVGSLFFLCLAVLVVIDMQARRSKSSPHIQSIS